MIYSYCTKCKKHIEINSLTLKKFEENGLNNTQEFIKCNKCEITFKVQYDNLKYNNLFLKFIALMVTFFGIIMCVYLLLVYDGMYLFSIIIPFISFPAIIIFGILRILKINEENFNTIKYLNNEKEYW